MRQIAETIGFAHGKHVVHRSLSPRAILVVHPESGNPQTVIMNWQLGYRQAAAGGTVVTQQVTATIHVDKLAEETTKVFMAPETFVDLRHPRRAPRHLLAGRGVLPALHRPGAGRKLRWPWPRSCASIAAFASARS